MNTHKLISALAVTVSTTALFVAAANPAFAQDSAPQDAVVEDATGQDAIIVTGTRRTDRTVADSTVPVDIISAEALLNSGQTETNKLLNQLVPSFNFPQPSLTDGTDSLRPATLRGLAPELVLLGTGTRQRFVHPRLLQPLAAARIGCESMTTPAACRTYNILMGEGRRVLAALLIDAEPAQLPFRDGAMTNAVTSPPL